MPDIKSIDGMTILRDDASKGEAFLKRYITQTDQGDAETRKEVCQSLKGIRQEEGYDNIITIDVVKSVLKTNNNTTPGPDGIQYNHFNELSDEELEKIVDDYNSSIRTSTVPEEWLHSYLKPLPKPGRNKKELNGYRIITMQNVYGKVLEKCMARILMNELENNGNLPEELGSYRPRKETWKNAGTFVYNGAMLERKVALRCGQWISSPQVIRPGLPQGSPLLPKLFNVYTARVATLNSVGPGRILTFADDILAYRQGRDRKKMTRELQQEVKKIMEWCAESTAVINP
ncbi:uncharacterized protein LOC106011589 [Aplysia californica]|uniref:Uncharacterized protein LOC106011589 n=1 Tax=Aplysia californica TaxID=6500 RepID=A0ABM0ZYJ4_APLCA|nr:uncharacterized protein LOC106011589 [Aplysia californica]